MKSATQVQILNEAVCFSLRANDIREGMNRFALPAMIDLTGFFILGQKTNLVEEKH